MTADDVGDDSLHASVIAALRARLTEVEERYALATAAALEGIYEWDVAAGRLLLTEQAKQFFALGGDALTPDAWNARIFADDYAEYRAAIVAHSRVAHRASSTNTEFTTGTAAIDGSSIAAWECVTRAEGSRKSSGR